jgi:hypothetical protein
MELGQKLESIRALRSDGLGHEALPKVAQIAATLGGVRRLMNLTRVDKAHKTLLTLHSLWISCGKNGANALKGLIRSARG